MIFKIKEKYSKEIKILKWHFKVWNFTRYKISEGRNYSILYIYGAHDKEFIEKSIVVSGLSGFHAITRVLKHPKKTVNSEYIIFKMKNVPEKENHGD